MSFVEFLGGVSQTEIGSLAERLTALESKFDDLNTNLVNVSAQTYILNEGLNELRSSFEEHKKNLEDSIDVTMALHLKKHPLPENIVSKMEELERMQRYLQHSQGRCLNDLDDIKKQLYDLYSHKIVGPTPEELSKMVAKSKDEILLIDIYDQRFGDMTSYHTKSQFSRMLKATGLKTLKDLLDMPYESLDSLKRCGPKNLAILQCIYEEYKYL